MFRLGGLVQAGSLQRSEQAGRPSARFRVTDGSASVEVNYTGILPDLFREGQGVVTLGRLRPEGTFAAEEVLAKHDETYMPKEVADALKKSGHWNPDQGPPPSADTWNKLAAAKKAGG
jgi:cytochrome c-type biogenesis protein CcmE